MMAIKTVVFGVVAFVKRRTPFPSIFGPPELRSDEQQMHTENAAAPLPTTLTLAFNVEKVSGKGEDADPVVVHTDDYHVVGVFDGMGGAGALQCDGPAGRRTGAFYASTLARGFTRDIAQRDQSLLTHGTPGDIAAHIYDELATKLNESAGLLSMPASKLRSALLRRLPTTAAVAVVRGSGSEVLVFWAGDSRVYLLAPAAGLGQLTRDHLRDDGDAMTNLERDAPLANCIHADRTFSIAWRAFQPTTGYLVIACTDGCFGFVASPMHFEQCLLDTMAAATTMDEWRERLIAALGEITGDDMSMAVFAVGWPTFEAMRAAFTTRQQLVSREVVGRLVQLDQDRAATIARLAELNAERRTAKERAWEEYRKSYDATAMTIAAGEATRAEG
jgi:serine/threonine protein phosphatase PrpC